jgi:hypothetical protein
MNKIGFTCPPAPLDKKKYISDLGKILGDFFSSISDCLD